VLSKFDLEQHREPRVIQIEMFAIAGFAPQSVYLPMKN